MSHDNSVDNFDRHYDSGPDIPSIQVTTDLSTPRLEAQLPLHTAGDALSPRQSPPLSPQPDHHSRSPSDGLLAPISIMRQGRMSLEVPSSPTGSSWGSDGSTHVPPSPTLSTRSSVQFAQQTTMALRDNNPSERSGLSSLGLLMPHGHGQGHGRKSSIASTLDGSTEGTEPDSHSIGLMTLAPSPSPTHTHFETSSFGGTTVHERSPSRSQDHPKKKVEDEGDEHDDGEAETKRPELDLNQDESIDPRPFAFKPYHLASLVDPKNLEALKEMGGVQGLLRGLGTHRKRGLQSSGSGSKEQYAEGGPRKSTASDGDGRPGTGTLGAGVGASQRHDRSGMGTDAGAVPGIVVTGDDGQAEEAKMEDPAPDMEGSDQAYTATMEDRHRVYGQNVLPSRKTKSLLQLMWLALKDKVLVCSCVHFWPIRQCSVVHADVVLGSSLDRSRGIIGPGILPRLWHSAACGRTSGRLGGGRGYHRRHPYCRE